ncbi:hypothetical protein TruAng_005018 [Truncatella angustata]|nr:hypothetical protein TruAng_005018 [Truncatella angustata]
MGAASTLSEGELCDKCQVFRLSKGRFTSSPFDEKRMYQLGSFADVTLRTYCSLCQFISQAFRNGPTPPSAVDGARVQGSWNQISDGSPNACLTIWLMPRSEDNGIPFNIRLVGDDDAPIAGSGRLISDSAIDPLMVTAWMSICQAHHECGNVALRFRHLRTLPPGFMLIDVVDLRLVKTTTVNRFIALSYVWGNSVKFKTVTSNVEDLKRENGLGHVWDQLNPTIRDAITFTRKLGERHIWIDSLCILQDNAENSQANIGAMDTIYQQAHLVIAAADDKAVEEGLRGVTKTRTPIQHQVEIRPGLRVLGVFNHSTYLDRSIYESRGWTFQEEHLSTRTLIFVNNQVYFSCMSHVFNEDVNPPSNFGADHSLLSAHISKRFIREGVQPTILYFKAVQAYTTRKLTYPELDMLNAFRGVGNVLSDQLATVSICGLPEGIFDLALLWQPVGHFKRRRGSGPSWSWTGWDGPVHWIGDTLALASYGYSATKEQEQTLVMDWLKERTWINWKRLSTSKGNKLVPLTVEDAKHSLNEDVGYDSAAPNKKSRYGRNIANRDPIIASYASQQTVQPQIATPNHISHWSPSAEGEFLCFYTLTAKFRIQHSGHYLRYGSIDPTYDFLMLSEANYYCDWGRPHENHPYKKFYGMGPDWAEFHVMMVEWKQWQPEGDGNQVTTAERVGIGRVLKEAVKDAWDEGPVWKEIVLG